MKQILIILSLGIALILLPISVSAQSPESHLYWYKAEVVRVIDGDTIVADIDLGFHTWRKSERLRLAGIDAPEMKGAERAAGIDAKRFVEGLLPVGKEIIINTIKARDGTDARGSFNRYLAVVWVGEMNLNERLIESGQAKPYRKRN